MLNHADIKITGPNKEKIRFSENTPVISFQLSCQPSLVWIKLFERIYRTKVHSKKPRVTITGDYLEFLFAGDSTDLQTTLNLINQDITETNAEYRQVLAAEQKQSSDVRKQRDAIGQELKNNLDDLKYD